MATPAATVRDYCTLLVKSRLLPADEVESLYGKWREERPGGDERVDSFRRFLVTRRALTEYQAALVQRGRADGFFLGEYKILDQIGKGQMGGVYKAAHTSGQMVALKILPASKARNSHILGRFQREARLLTQFDHPNVVRAYQVGESGSINYIVMEYLEGETLNEVLERRTRLPLGEAARLMRQALDGLQHLYEKRMVHRDVKPSNMMLTPEPAKGKPDTTWEATVKILDIGLGRELFDEDVSEAQIDTQLTQEGSVLGTPDYLAPEQAKDARTADIRADIYSIGCVLYHCLTGRPPFNETNIMAQMLKHATQRPVPVAAATGTDVPAAFQAVLDRFLAKRADDRYRTPAEAAAALAPFATTGATPVAANLVPAYRDWLESESHPELAKIALPAPQPPAAPPPGRQIETAPWPSLPRTAPPKSGTVPALPPQAPPLPLPVENEVDVELVTDPAPAARAVRPPLPTAPMDRPVWPPDRRDWMMLAAGAFGVLSAVGLGYGLAKVLRRKPEPEQE
ncbi:serine/threonine-protein kinase [Frigoriglobus tundricola]|uniref:Serine/threonine protein kinase n=1 Tax=Frigoriglobus tundricola TaxID=2774151 RepID=A0A6M5YNY0_9BACT|nr:serine/threonine-protein kinase [Frigoriglobus tundricola]QJW95678.1 Serine/threonine protein kinase [Frigoriglobus tundricola]